MKIILNEKETYIEKKDENLPYTPLSDVLEKIKEHPSRLCLQVNGKLIPRNLWNSTPIAKDDVIEAIAIIAGG